MACVWLMHGFRGHPMVSWAIWGHLGKVFCVTEGHSNMSNLNNNKKLKFFLSPVGCTWHSYGLCMDLGVILRSLGPFEILFWGHLGEVVFVTELKYEEPK